MRGTPKNVVRFFGDPDSPLSRRTPLRPEGDACVALAFPALPCGCAATYISIWLRRSGPLAGCIVRWEKQVQFLRPREESFCRVLDLLLIVRAFKPMQHLVPSIHARTRLVLAQQRNRIGHGANGAPIPDVELALEEKLGGVPHARANLGPALWFRPQRVPVICDQQRGKLGLLPLPVLNGERGRGDRVVLPSLSAEVGYIRLGR